MNTTPIAWALAIVAVAATAGLPAQTTPIPARDLTQMSLDDLLDVKVTSVSKKEQKLSTVGAAIFVITQEDIRRSGATNVPDLLRMVPGTHVAQINSNTWAINIRGLSEIFGDFVLVLIDGRSIYGTSFSGVDWDAHDLPLEDIERIEVIRGPGGTVWGANAVNGVINIITKSSKATLGGLISAGAGTRELGRGLVQFGGKAGDKGTYRIFGSVFDISSSPSPGIPNASDAWHGLTLGFRSDWDLSKRDQLTVQADVRRNPERETADTLFSNLGYVDAVVQNRVTQANGNVLGRWTRKLSEQSELVLQGYYNREFSIDEGLKEYDNTFDFDFRHRFVLGLRQNITWGAGYRLVSLATTPGYSISFVPPDRKDSLFSLFVQDEVKLSRAVTLTVGSRLEHNSYSGFEYEPSAQVVWAGSRNSAWLSVSRAIRQPSLGDIGIREDLRTFPLSGGGFGVEQQVGSPSPKHEELRALQLGYRASLGKRFSLDTTFFYNRYSDLQTSEPGTPYYVASPAPAHWVYPLVFDSQAKGRALGAELFGTWIVTPRWKLRPSYSWTRIMVSTLSSSSDTSAQEEVGRTPVHQWALQSTLDLPHRLELDSSLAFVGRLAADGVNPVPAYARFDTRFGWKASESVDFSIVGQNLLRPLHTEYYDADGIFHTLVKRSVFAKVTWRFR